MDVMKTLFLNPPSYDDFDGGAGSRYQATREVWSFWYPTWLAYPAGLIPGARLLDAPPHDYTPELASIAAPVLLIHGRYDRMVPFEVSIAILNHIADSRLVLLNNCGHWPPFEKPAEWAAQVLAFLRGY